MVARPDIVLFDEPLSNLDARLRDLVRTEIHELHARIGFTAVYVTHDQVEALALGDRLAIMREGALEQLATPEQVFEEPATDYVAGFIGMGNRLELERRDGHWTHDGASVEGLTIDTPAKTIFLRTRSEDVDLSPPSESSPHDSLAFQGAIVDSEFGGRHIDVVLTIGETRVQSRIPAGERESWARTPRAWPTSPRVDQATRHQGIRRRREAPADEHPVPRRRRLSCRRTPSDTPAPVA